MKKTLPLHKCVKFQVFKIHVVTLKKKERDFQTNQERENLFNDDNKQRPYGKVPTKTLRRGSVMSLIKGGENVHQQLLMKPRHETKK